MAIFKTPKARFALLIVVLSALALSIFAMNRPPLKTGELVVGDYSEYFQNTDANVVIYGFSTCQFCRRARAGMNDEGIQYEFRDIREHQAFARDFSSMRATKVPMLLTDRGFILGYSEEIHAKFMDFLTEGAG